MEKIVFMGRVKTNYPILDGSHIKKFEKHQNKSSCNHAAYCCGPFQLQFLVGLISADGYSLSGRRDEVFFNTDDMSSRSESVKNLILCASPLSSLRPDCMAFEVNKHGTRSYNIL